MLAQMHIVSLRIRLIGGEPEIIRKEGSVAAFAARCDQILMMYWTATFRGRVSLSPPVPKPPPIR